MKAKIFKRNLNFIINQNGTTQRNTPQKKLFEISIPLVWFGVYQFTEK
jgi:hypothetical protein